METLKERGEGRAVRAELGGVVAEGHEAGERERVHEDQHQPDVRRDEVPSVDVERIFFSEKKDAPIRRCLKLKTRLAETSPTPPSDSTWALGVRRRRKVANNK